MTDCVLAESIVHGFVGLHFICFQSKVSQQRSRSCHFVASGLMPADDKRNGCGVSDRVLQECKGVCQHEEDKSARAGRRAGKSNEAWARNGYTAS